MIDLTSLTLWQAILIFVSLASIITVAGTYLSRTADQLADITGIGEALIGGVLLGGVTSLSGIVTSVTAAWEGHPELSFSNAVGGIAVQTLFLALADLAYSRANLEHAAASLANLMQGVLLMMMLGFVTLVMMGPDFSWFQLHPGSIILFGIYILGTRLTSIATEHPMWKPSQTPETVNDIPDEQNLRAQNLTFVLIRFIGAAAVVGIAGYFVAKIAIVITQQTGISESFMGALATSTATSLPELVVSVSAVRQGALTLAVGNIIGGNSFDVLFLAFADIAYRQGSLYHHVGDDQLYILALTILLTGVLLLGLLHRQKQGIGGVGWESATLILTFLLGYFILYFF